MKPQILRECIRIALEKNDNHPQYGCFHHFSFIVQKNALVGWGTNRSGSPWIERGYPEYGKLHSETEVYRKVKGILEKDVPFEIVNVRLNRQGNIRLSKPCPCCWNFLESLGCKYVWFTTGSNIGAWAKVRL